MRREFLRGTRGFAVRSAFVRWSAPAWLPLVLACSSEGSDAARAGSPALHSAGAGSHGGGVGGSSSTSAGSGGTSGQRPNGGAAGAALAGSSGFFAGAGAAPSAGAGGVPSAGAGGSAPSGGTGGSAQAGSAGASGSPGSNPACTPPARYRNLFAELLSKSEAETDAKIAAAFQSLFHGGGEKSVYYEQGDEAYILDANNNDVRSEGISYGMMIAVELDKKDEFTKLWKFAKQHMAQGGNNAGLFTWRTNTQGQATAQGSAPDGEEYFATALIFASKRWGDGSGIDDYSSEAQIVLDATANKLFDRERALVKFLADVNYTDPSYVLPAFYAVWACFDAKNQEFWERAASAGRAFFQKTTHPETGLAPYLANYDGSPSNALGGGSTFQSDAWRVVGNIMMDHHWFAADPWQPTWAAKYAAFFRSTNPGADEFNLDGTVLRQNGSVASTALVSQNALVAFGVPEQAGEPFVRVLWELPIPTGRYRYYDGMLYLLALLHVSGRFQLWY